MGIQAQKTRSSFLEENTKMVVPFPAQTMTSSTLFRDAFPVAPAAARELKVNTHQVKHFLPSSISCTERLPLVGHISYLTIQEPNKEYLESSSTESTSKSVQDVHISARLMEEFMELARANTNSDLETCGILGAFLENKVFFITTLIIPKQESTSSSVCQIVDTDKVFCICKNYSVRCLLLEDFHHVPKKTQFSVWQCQAINEEEIYAIQEERSLFTAGWIHTHPSQSCFLSSIDLHTQYSYQVMLPEAVAIVMAPTDSTRSYGIFRLTDPGGMTVLRHCQEKGFHPHPETADGSPIFESCSNVYINPNLRFEIIDLRASSR